ncbi:MAG: hypothetical protein WCW16_02275 [Candidatus Magasanikbacteria bacterium]
MNINFFPHKKRFSLDEPHEYRSAQSLRIINFLVIGATIAILGVSAWFIYSYIYLTIGKVENIMLINTAPHFEPINFKSYDDAMDAWNNKNELPVQEIIVDPFYPQTSTTTSTATTTPDIPPILPTGTAISL